MTCNSQDHGETASVSQMNTYNEDMKPLITFIQINSTYKLAYIVACFHCSLKRFNCEQSFYNSHAAMRQL